jgi:hypothetical protein
MKAQNSLPTQGAAHSGSEFDGMERKADDTIVKAMGISSLDSTDR